MLSCLNALYDLSTVSLILPLCKCVSVLYDFSSVPLNAVLFECVKVFSLDRMSLPVMLRG